MMKKFFKNPLEVQKSDVGSVLKVLKKVFPQGIEGSSFFYKAAFEYDNGEYAPFLYIGPIDENWRKYIKASKKDKDFVSGVCKLETDVDDKSRQKLLLKAEVGKGSKAIFLKKINRELLKKAGVKAEFVEELTVELQEEEIEEVVENTTPTASPKELSTEFKVIEGTLKIIQKEHNEQQIDDLLDQIEDWEDAYKTLDRKARKDLAQEQDRVKKIVAYLQKVNQIDSKIDLLFDKIEVLIVAYLKREEHTSNEALNARKKLEKSIEKIETLAAKINDDDFIETCKEFRKVLAI